MDYSDMARVLAPALSVYFPAFGVDNVGVWTPTLVGGTTPGSFTYDVANTGGFYTRIGNRMFVTGRVRISAITVAPTGTIEIGGLPMAASTSTWVISGGGSFGAWTGFTLTAGKTQVGIDVLSGSSTLRILESGSAAAAASIQAAGLALVGGFIDLRFNADYQVG